MSDDTITVLRTGKMVLFDMAVDLFKESKLPHFTHQESSSGLREALPAMPTGGPGCFFVIRVPEQRAAEAKALLDSLPFPTGTNPEPWDYDNQAKPLPRWAQIALMGALACGIVVVVYKALWQG